MAMKSAYYHLPGTSGEHEMKDIKRHLKLLPGVKTVSIGPESHRLAVDYDPGAADEETIEKTLRELGIDFSKQKEPDDLQ